VLLTVVVGSVIVVLTILGISRVVVVVDVDVCKVGKYGMGTQFSGIRYLSDVETRFRNRFSVRLRRLTCASKR
jgi:hypothetical protein